MAQLHHGTHVVEGRTVASWSGGTRGALPAVVFVPGLGAPGYLLPWARAVADWTRTWVLDLPGWRRGRARSCPPTLTGVATGVNAWLAAVQPGPVVLVGHSTGSQAVVRAALLRPEAVSGIVLAGPTFAPESRTFLAVLRRAATTLVWERTAELPAVVPSYVHSGGRPLLRFLRDGLADRPEQRVGGLRPPVLVMTGRRDGFAPPAWGVQLAAVASGLHVTLPGAHNFCFPYADLADAVLHDAVDGWTSDGSALPTSAAG